jgi:large subunit ribosomal protein L22
MKAILRSVRITSKKLNLIADLVRTKNVNDAVNLLKFTPKKGAKILYKVVKSAVANAENNFKQERPSLFIKEIIVTEGPTMKRSVPISRGRMNPILKRTAHVTVLLGVRGDEVDVKVEKEKKQEAPKKSAKDSVATSKKKTAVKADPKEKKSAAKSSSKKTK